LIIEKPVGRLPVRASEVISIFRVPNSVFAAPLRQVDAGFMLYLALSPDFVSAREMSGY